eukprot:Sdes_comp20241_c0_seq1m13662
MIHGRLPCFIRNSRRSFHPSRSFFSTSPPAFAVRNKTTASLPQNGQLYVWGANDSGALFSTPSAPISAPTCVGYLGPITNYTHLAAGYAHSVVCGTDERGKTVVLTAGLNQHGQLGVSPTAKAKAGESYHHLESLSEYSVQSVSCGRCHTGLILGNIPSASSADAVCSPHARGKHHLLTFGGNFHGQLGNQPFPHSPSNHTPALFSADPIQVFCGFDHTLVLTCDRKLFSCGWGCDGQLGLGKKLSEAHKTADFAEISFGAESRHARGRVGHLSTFADSCIALSEGSMYAWGNSEYSQIFLGNHHDKFDQPTRVACFDVSHPNIRFSKVAVGGTFSLALSTRGELFACGFGAVVGDTSDGKSDRIVRIPPCDDGLKFVDIFPGSEFVAAICEKNNLYIWGFPNTREI